MSFISMVIWACTDTARNMEKRQDARHNITFLIIVISYSYYSVVGTTYA